MKNRATKVVIVFSVRQSAFFSANAIAFRIAPNYSALSLSPIAQFTLCVIDVTPHDGKPEILFLTDPVKVWEKKPVSSKRLALEKVIMSKTKKLVRVTMGNQHEPTEEERAFYHGWRPCSEVRGKDVAESERVRRAIRAAPKECWVNARKAILGLDELADASYVEGWVILLGGLVADHGWLAKDGQIIDPTLPDRVVAYFAGLEFHGRAGIAEFTAHSLGRKHRNDPFHWAFGWGGEHSPSYMKAFRDAFEYQKKHFTERGEKDEDSENQGNHD